MIFQKWKDGKILMPRDLKSRSLFEWEVDVIDYFKKMADETGIPYQNLINSYLRDCVQSHRKISIKWAS